MLEKDKLEIQQDFKKYCKFMMPDFKWHDFQYAVMDRMEEGTVREQRATAIFALPARHGSTLIGTILFLSYMTLKYPNTVGVSFSYNKTMADEKKDYYDRVLNSNRYQEIYPKNLSISHKVEFTKTGDELLGKQYDYAVLDDIIKNPCGELAEEQYKLASSWINKILSPRLGPGAAIYGFLCQGDKISLAFIASLKGTWNVYDFPCIKGKLNNNPLDLRKEGEPLIKEMLPLYKQMASQGMLTG